MIGGNQPGTDTLLPILILISFIFIPNKPLNKPLRLLPDLLPK